MLLSLAISDLQLKKKQSFLVVTRMWNGQENNKLNKSPGIAKETKNMIHNIILGSKEHGTMMVGVSKEEEETMDGEDKAEMMAGEATTMDGENSWWNDWSDIKTKYEK